MERSEDLRVEAWEVDCSLKFLVHPHMFEDVDLFLVLSIKDFVLEIIFVSM